MSRTSPAMQEKKSTAYCPRSISFHNPSQTRSTINSFRTTFPFVAVCVISHTTPPSYRPLLRPQRPRIPSKGSASSGTLATCPILPTTLDLLDLQFLPLSAPVVLRHKGNRFWSQSQVSFSLLPPFLVTNPIISFHFSSPSVFGHRSYYKFTFLFSLRFWSQILS